MFLADLLNFKKVKRASFMASNEETQANSTLYHSGHCPHCRFGHLTWNVKTEQVIKVKEKNGP